MEFPERHILFHYETMYKVHKPVISGVIYNFRHRYLLNCCTLYVIKIRRVCIPYELYFGTDFSRLYDAHVIKRSHIYTTP